MKEEGRERQDWEAEREMGSSEGINRHAQTPHELDDVQTATINRAQARPGSGLTLSQHRTDDSAGEGPRNGKRKPEKGMAETGRKVATAAAERRDQLPSAAHGTARKTYDRGSPLACNGGVVRHDHWKGRRQRLHLPATSARQHPKLRTSNTRPNLRASSIESGEHRYGPAPNHIEPSSREAQSAGWPTNPQLRGRPGPETDGPQKSEREITRITHVRILLPLLYIQLSNRLGGQFDIVLEHGEDLSETQVIFTHDDSRIGGHGRSRKERVDAADRGRRRPGNTRTGLERS